MTQADARYQDATHAGQPPSESSQAYHPFCSTPPGITRITEQSVKLYTPSALFVQNRSEAQDTVGCHKMKIIIYSLLVLIIAAQARAQPTNAVVKDWQVTTNAFGANFDRAITFTYQSRLSGTQHVEINEEIMQGWQVMAPIADQSGMTQALVTAKVNQTNSPPEWRTDQCLRFQRTDAGQWILKSLRSTNNSGRCIADRKKK